MRRVRYHDPRNGCDTSRLVGFVAECICGWRGKSRHLRYVAAADLNAHKITEHGR